MTWFDRLVHFFSAAFQVRSQGDHHWGDTGTARWPPDLAIEFLTIFPPAEGLRPKASW